jgi:Mg-chelatase subunit ChlI
LLLVAKAYAAREGRDFVIPDDVKEAAQPVLRHRLVLRPEAELEGFDADRVVGDVVAATAGTEVRGSRTQGAEPRTNRASWTLHIEPLNVCRH